MIFTAIYSTYERILLEVISHKICLTGTFWVSVANYGNCTKEAFRCAVSVMCTEALYVLVIHSELCIYKKKDFCSRNF